MKWGASFLRWTSAGQRALSLRPSADELGARIQFLWHLFSKRLSKMPPWMADEFTKILVGVARGPLRDFEVRCGMMRLVHGLRRGMREADRG